MIEIISFSKNEYFDSENNKRYSVIYKKNGKKFKDDRKTTENYTENQYKKLLENEIH